VLIPKNVETTTEAELNVRGVRLTEVVDILKNNAPDAVHFVVLDACRNNIRGQKGAKGFVPVNDQRAGVVLAFATAAGQTASDDGASSGPYVAALADEIVVPQAVFNSVRSRVVTSDRTSADTLDARWANRRHENYQGAPVDGSAWITGECEYRVLRGGSWVDDRDSCDPRSATGSRPPTGGSTTASDWPDH
jgi:caspase domain-containing protein